MGPAPDRRRHDVTPQADRSNSSCSSAVGPYTDGSGTSISLRIHSQLPAMMDEVVQMLPNHFSLRHSEQNVITVPEIPE